MCIFGGGNSAPPPPAPPAPWAQASEINIWNSFPCETASRVVRDYTGLYAKFNSKAPYFKQLSPKIDKFDRLRLVSTEFSANNQRILKERQKIVIDYKTD